MSGLAGSFQLSIRLGSAGLWISMACSMAAWGQQQVPYTRSTLIDQANSRAEHQAEEMVSLSADKIVDLLRAEPGLLLEVKKSLIRKAFEQGRILDPADLTDDALFSLIREDEDVRIAATQQIEDRSYIRAKP